MISYAPLKHYMIDNKIDRQYLLDNLDISSTTYTKLNKDEYVRLDIIEKICLHFDIPIEKVIQITPGKSDINPLNRLKSFR